MENSYTTNGTYDSDVPLIKVKKGYNTKEANWYNQFAIMALFHCLSQSTMADIKTVIYCFILLLIVRVVNQMLHTEEILPIDSVMSQKLSEAYTTKYTR